jgi:hypothetical protein
LICESYDDKGNVIVYRYKSENKDEVKLSKAHERNRTQTDRSANRYLKRIRYGNHKPYFPVLSGTAAWPAPPGADALDGSTDWFFEIVLDYGEHDEDSPLPGERSRKWDCRNDPFSSYRAGFEVRTYRLCQRVLMFHHFPGEEGVQADCLVRSTDFTYSFEKDPTDVANPIFSFLLSVTQTGYKRNPEGGYIAKSLPPLEFEYSKPEIDQTVREVDPKSLENLPRGFDGRDYQLVDLDGEGLSGILTEQGGSWFYKRNLSPNNIHIEDDREITLARFGPLELVAQLPSSSTLSGGRGQLLDLSADGHLDLVRIRNGEVCYWPNLGYCRFGAKVTMDDSPCFDHHDMFNPSRIRLADIDGSGLTDIIYFGSRGVALYFNQSGNSWSPARHIDAFPATDDPTSLQVVDLLCNGAACLVWSSPLPGDSRAPMRYLNLIGANKPHLLVKTRNNLGAETSVHYAPSTKFQLQDEIKGTPWLTRLPFPVHVVERVETYDPLSRNRFVTSYAYHHGYFDGDEREFRGFGMVEQVDTEQIGTARLDSPEADHGNFDEVSFVPPVRTRTWFHTGAWLRGDRISLQFEKEYYREGDPSPGRTQGGSTCAPESFGNSTARGSLPTWARTL